jgi:hypothetical protein
MRQSATAQSEVPLLMASFPVQYPGLLTQDFEFGSDGMPLSPVTPGLFRDALNRVSLSPSAVIARDEARHVEVTVEEAVFMALSAGCLPAAAPVVIGAVQAWFVDADRRLAAGPGLAGTSQVIVVNGPVRNELDVNSGLGVFGPGWRGNATIGRALRLILTSKYSVDPSAFGDPGQYSFCFAEDEDTLGWTPLAQQRGIPAGNSAVTVYSVTKYGKSLDRSSTTVADHLDFLATFLRGDAGGAHWYSEPVSLLVVVNFEWRRVLVERGVTKETYEAQLLERLIGDALLGSAVAIGPGGVSAVAAGGAVETSVWCFVCYGTAPSTVDIMNLG